MGFDGLVLLGLFDFDCILILFGLFDIVFELV